MPKETWKDANKRKACLICGKSNARTFKLKDNRIVRACNQCLPSTNWLNNSIEQKIN